MPTPLISIGLAVYNGQNFVADAIESVLSQTFADFELIVTDNASMDATPEIAAEFVRRDSRVRYYRNAENLGCAPNLNRCYELSNPKTRYFKWAAHDDVIAPTFLERCVEALEADSSAAMAHTRSVIIDATGDVIPVEDDPYAARETDGATDLVESRANLPISPVARDRFYGLSTREPVVGVPVASDRANDLTPRADWIEPVAGMITTPPLHERMKFLEINDPPGRHLDAATPSVRFDDLILRTLWCFEIFGLMRRDAIVGTPLHGSYYGSDKVLLAYLLLKGRCIELDEPLFLRRWHSGASHGLPDEAAKAAWMNPKTARKTVFPRLQCLAGYFDAVKTADISTGERMACLGTLAQYAFQLKKWRKLLGGASHAA